MIIQLSPTTRVALQLNSQWALQELNPIYGYYATVRFLTDSEALWVRAGNSL